MNAWLADRQPTRHAPDCQSRSGRPLCHATYRAWRIEAGNGHQHVHPMAPSWRGFSRNCTVFILYPMYRECEDADKKVRKGDTPFG